MHVYSHTLGHYCFLPANHWQFMLYEGGGEQGDLPLTKFTGIKEAFSCRVDFEVDLKI